MTVPIFTKASRLDNCIFDLDDWYPHYTRNALSELFWLKNRFPQMKVTLFTVPDHPDSPWQETQDFIKFLLPFSSWIRLACHGWHHKTPTEAKNWTEEEAREVLTKWKRFWKQYHPRLVDLGFKAPGWQISDATYKVLLEMGYWVADHTYNEERRPKSLPAYTLAHPWCYHGHTWDLPNEDPKYRNGIRQLFEEHKLPWHKDTKFHFVSEVCK